MALEIVCRTVNAFFFFFNLRTVPSLKIGFCVYTQDFAPFYMSELERSSCQKKKIISKEWELFVESVCSLRPKERQYVKGVLFELVKCRLKSYPLKR